MANGYCPALLAHINDIAGGNSPHRRIHIAGFLKMLFAQQNSTVSPINQGYKDNSHIQTLTVKYRHRPTSAHIQDDDNCDINRIPQYSEWTLPNLLYRQTSFFLSDEEIKKYCDDASRSVQMGQPATSLMNEHFDLWVEHANALMREINLALVTEMATQFGENVTIGSAAGKVININRAGMDLNLSNGIIDLLQDVRENQIIDQPAIVGGGLFSAYEVSRLGLGLSQAGIDASRFGLPPFFYDKDTQNIWGTNSFGMFAKGSVKFISYNRYLGAFGGAKGNSVFLTAPFPVEQLSGDVDNAGVLRDLRLDIQIRYIDCPTEIDVNGTPTTVNRGWQVIISKYFQLWAQPTSGFPAGDELENTNGTLLYFADNNCENCNEPNGSYVYTP